MSVDDYNADIKVCTFELKTFAVELYS